MWRVIFISFIFLFYGCKNEQSKYVIIPSSIFSAADTMDIDTMGLGYSRLSQYKFFNGNLNKLLPSKNVLPYKLNASLFSDYAEKDRFIYIPPDKSLAYKDNLTFEYPDGCVLIKNFYFKSYNKKRIIETRLLIKENDIWKPVNYVWNEDQSEAYFWPIGKEIQIEHPVSKEDFFYEVPDLNQCKNCHMKNGFSEPIGPSPANWNLDISNVNQLTSFSHRIKNLPNLVDIYTLPNYENDNLNLEERARAYLHINCSSCHNKKGSARTSGLDLSIDNKDYYSLGINKSPVAAGKASGDRFFDIVPGKPEESILLYRMENNDPSIRMPEIGRNMIHEEGVKLIRNWIESL